MVRVLMNGAFGKMGRSVSAGLAGLDNMEIVAAVDVKKVDTDFGFLCGLEPFGFAIENDLDAAIKRVRPDVIVDFTNPQAVMKNVNIGLFNQVPMVVGTTGFSPEDYKTVEGWSKENNTPIFIGPNFALGAVLMMKYAADAARYFPHAEIIERHHDQKLDAPSGTAVTTLEMMSENREAMAQGNPKEFEKFKGSRGGDYEGMKVHSVRLPGYVATQEIVFGAVGQVLTIRHDALNRDSYVPGVALAIEKMADMEGLVYGLDKLL